MTLILGSIHISRLYALGVKNFTDEDFKVKQNLLVNSTFKLPEIKTKLSMEFQSINLRQDKITATHKTTSLSWGEEIEIKLMHEGTNNYEYLFSSKSNTILTLIDYGINRENVLNIRKLIES